MSEREQQLASGEAAGRQQLEVLQAAAASERRELEGLHKAKHEGEHRAQVLLLQLLLCCPCCVLCAEVRLQVLSEWEVTLAQKEAQLGALEQVRVLRSSCCCYCCYLLLLLLSG